MDNKSFLRFAKKVCNWLLKRKSIIMAVIATILFVITPALVNLLVNTEAFFLPSLFGFVSADNKDTWISFFGAMIGGAITLIGVAWTIVDQNNKRREDAKDAVKPILVSKDVTYEAIKGIVNDKTGTKIYECTLNYKNVGKGILYNPGLYDIICTIDDVPVHILQAPIPILSYIDAGESVQGNIMIELKPEVLSAFFERLKDGGNTLLLKIIMYVGGVDMYGSATVTRLIYTKKISWFSELDIEKELFEGKFVSEILFDKQEIARVVEHRNPELRRY